MPSEQQLKKWREYNKRKDRNIYLKKYRRGKGTFHRLSRQANYLYKNGTLTSFDLWKIAKKQKLKCALSGVKLTCDNASLDHLISKSRGGVNIPSNVRLVIKEINIARQIMTDEQFISMCQNVVKFNNL